MGIERKEVSKKLSGYVLRLVANPCLHQHTFTTYSLSVKVIDAGNREDILERFESSAGTVSRVFPGRDPYTWPLASYQH